MRIVQLAIFKDLEKDYSTLQMEYKKQKNLRQNYRRLKGGKYEK